MLQAPPPEESRRLALATVTLAVLVFLVPVVLDLATNPRGVFGYLVSDVFYYLTIARNHSELGLWSFDGQHLTNGYHPLWQWMLSPVYGATMALGAGDALLPLLVFVGLACIAAAIVLLGRAIQHGGRLSPLFPLIVPGFTALLSTPIYQPAHDREAFQDPASARPIFTTLWSYANGMETPLLILAFAACVLFFVRRPTLDSNAAAAGLGLLLLSVTFARLDHVFFAGVLWLGYAVRAWTARDRGELGRVALAGSVLGVGLVVYLLGNHLVFGSAMPISGSSKSSFPSVSANAWVRLRQLVVNPPDQWVSGATRLVQLLVPIVVAAIYLPLTVRFTPARPHIELRPTCGRVEELLAWTAVAVLVLGSYNVLFVLLVHMGSWYFPLSTVFVSLVLLTALDRWSLARRWYSGSRRPVAVLAIVGVGVGVYFVRAQYRPTYLAAQAAFYYDEAPRVRAYYLDRGELPHLVEYDDGIVTFATGFPAMSGFGLTLDREAMQEKDRGRLVALAIARGYNHVASLNYVEFAGDTWPTSAAASRAYKWIKKDERSNLQFSAEYHSLESGFTIFEVSAATGVDDEE